MREECKCSESNRWKTLLAVGAAVMMALIGLGGCWRLADTGSDQPLISIKTTEEKP